jgi:hypothetical protein
MTRRTFVIWPLALAGLLLAVVVCWAVGFNPLAWALEQAHQLAREMGGR